MGNYNSSDRRDERVKYVALGIRRYEKDGQAERHVFKCGVAFEGTTKENGEWKMDVKLHSFPVGGELVIIVDKPRDDRDNRQGGGRR